MTERNGVAASNLVGSKSSVHVASISVVVGGALWGLYWIPIRMFEDLGLTGAWPGFMIYIAALLVLAPFTFFVKAPAVSKWHLASIGIMTGAAFTFYGTAIILTDVLRALLFFYLTPVWGTAIGVMFLGERLTVARVLAIVMAFAGLFAVVGFGSRSAMNLGDFLALSSGFFWAVGTYKIYRLGRTSAFHLTLAFLLGSIVVTLALMLLANEYLGPRPAFPSIETLMPYFIVSGLFAAPMIMLTIWPASLLTPGRMGILLMSEVVVGIGSVALLAGEPFGPYEAIGAILILSASVTEVLGNKTASG